MRGGAEAPAHPGPLPDGGQVRQVQAAGQEDGQLYLITYNFITLINLINSSGHIRHQCLCYSISRYRKGQITFRIFSDYA